MFCNKCGKEILTDSLFCPSCGASIKADNQSQNFPQRKSSRNKIILGIVLIVIGIFIGFLLSKNNLDKRIVGEWKSDEYYNGMHDWTFYEDGSFRFYAVTGTYIVKGNKLTVHVMSGLVGNFFEEYKVNIRGDRMTLTNLEDGVVTHLTKIN